VQKHYNAKVRANAKNAMRNSALARALRNDDDVGIAKSNPSDPIRRAYREVQNLTNPKHRQINESIVKVLADLGVAMPQLAFEYRPFGEDKTRELRCDAWFVTQDRPEALEFTHRADGDATTAVVASYVLSKIQDYARDYGLT
jgi:16S rRNA C1402 N4-methylase RsmH